MKKVVLMIAFVLGGFMAANASYLYWQVDASTHDNSPNVSTLYAYTGSQYYALGMSEGLSGSFNTDTWTGDSITWSSNDTKYFVELANYDTTTYTATSNYGPLNYSDISATVQLTELGKIATAWGAAQYTAGAVPEPTSGLLTLIGMALLGLRRKRA